MVENWWEGLRYMVENLWVDLRWLERLQVPAEMVGRTTGMS
jgi:hypothetical protein